MLLINIYTIDYRLLESSYYLIAFVYLLPLVIDYIHFFCAYVAKRFFQLFFSDVICGCICYVSCGRYIIFLNIWRWAREENWFSHIQDCKSFSLVCRVAYPHISIIASEWCLKYHCFQLRGYESLLILREIQQRHSFDWVLTIPHWY